jgi:hypothetical protein
VLLLQLLLLLQLYCLVAAKCLLGSVGRSSAPCFAATLVEAELVAAAAEALILQLASGEGLVRTPLVVAFAMVAPRDHLDCLSAHHCCCCCCRRCQEHHMRPCLQPKPASS